MRGLLIAALVLLSAQAGRADLTYANADYDYAVKEISGASMYPQAESPQPNHGAFGGPRG